jgi:hypothetical protein
MQYQIEATNNVKYQIVELNNKIDQLLEIKKSKLVTEPVLNCRNRDHVWSIEFNNENFLIKYNYNTDFAKTIKRILVGDQILLKWDKYLLGWVASKEFHNQVFFDISDNFPEWECIDKRCLK